MINRVVNPVPPPKQDFVQVNFELRHLTFNPFIPYGPARRRPEIPLDNDQNRPQEIHRSVFINENRMARKREITTGAANAHVVEVLSGLKEGEMVMAVGSVEITEYQFNCVATTAEYLKMRKLQLLAGSFLHALDDSVQNRVGVLEYLPRSASS